MRSYFSSPAKRLEQPNRGSAHMIGVLRIAQAHSSAMSSARILVSRAQSFIVTVCSYCYQVPIEFSVRRKLLSAYFYQCETFQVTCSFMSRLGCYGCRNPIRMAEGPIRGCQRVVLITSTLAMLAPSNAWSLGSELPKSGSTRTFPLVGPHSENR